MFDALFISSSEINHIYNCTAFRWHPKIGEPHIMGWITVLCYALTAALCFKVQSKLNKGHGTMRFFWIALTLLMVFLAINKQLDLQSLATAATRCVSQLNGWYADRRAFQVSAIITLGICAILVCLFFLWLLRKDIKTNAIALLGLTQVLGFVMIRVVSFHHFDAILGVRFGSFRLNWLFELSGLILISLNALAILLSRSKAS